MKNNKILLLFCILLTIVFALLFLNLFIGGTEVNYDNNKSITSLVTQRVSHSDIKKMFKDMESNSLTYAKLKSSYNIQCLRKTYQGYYAVFLQKDSKRIFVFMDRDMQVYNILMFESIKKNDDYNFLEAGKTTESEVLRFDTNTVLMPTSSVLCTAHIIQEGLLLITYDRLDMTKGGLISDPIVNSVAFFKNDDFPLADNDMLNLNVPYILEKDKK